MLDFPPQYLNQQDSYYFMLATNDSTMEKIKDSLIGLIMDPDSNVLVEYAKKVKAEFDDGFQWSDIPAIIEHSKELVSHILDAKSKRDAVIKIIDKVIDLTDTPFLPDDFTDPLFKAMIHPFVNLAFNLAEGNLSLNDLSPWDDADSTSALSDEELSSFTRKLKASFEDGFQWSDLATVMSLSIEFVDSFEGMTQDKKRAQIIKIMNDLIDITDTPYLPDTFTDPIFKQIVPPFVDFFMKTRG